MRPVLGVLRGCPVCYLGNPVFIPDGRIEITVLVSESLFILVDIGFRVDSVWVRLVIICFVVVFTCKRKGASET